MVAAGEISVHGGQIFRVNDFNGLVADIYDLLGLGKHGRERSRHDSLAADYCKDVNRENDYSC